jgi:transketolase
VEKRFINRGNKATKSGFGEGLLMAGSCDPRIVALGADITTSVGVSLFAEKFPDRFISLGIAEQNCVGFAAGLSLSGKIPVFSTYGVFASLRAADQIRVSVCYNDLHVIIGGAHAGVSVGPDGATHQALEDIAVMRVMPNMTLLSPCDATQARILTISAIENLNGPVYIRFGREAMPDFTHEDMETKIGTAQLLHKGSDLAIIATGHLTWEALQAAYALEKGGIHARVLNIHTIKPIDEKIILEAANETGLILTAEEHQVAGGLGSAVAEVVSHHSPVRVKMIGIRDCFGESGDPMELMRKFGLTAPSIEQAALELLKAKC